MLLVQFLQSYFKCTYLNDNLTLNENSLAELTKMFTEKMCPNISGLCVDSYDRFETFGSRERGSVAEMQEIVVLQPLGQVREVNHLKAAN